MRRGAPFGAAQGIVTVRVARAILKFQVFIYFSKIASVTPSLPQRGRLPKG